MKESVYSLDGQQQESRSKIAELERQLREKPIDVTATVEVEKVPEEVEKELLELRKKAGQQSATIKFKVHFDDLVKNFQELLDTLGEIAAVESVEEYERYKSAVLKLIGKMSERLG